MSYFDDFLPILEGFEGSVPWMYLDTVGVVTVGVGFAIASTRDAAAMPFFVDGRAASLQEVIADWARVKVCHPAHLPAYYRTASSPQLQAAMISSLLAVGLKRFDVALAERLPGYSTAPDPAKMALLDMGYNLGVDGLLRKFPHLVGAVANHDWLMCSAACRRGGISDERNDWTQEQFAAAQKLVTG